MSSRQTKDARAVHGAALDKSRRHVQVCSVCRDAKERKRAALRCAEGQELASAAAAAGREAARQERLDLAPIPGQLTLLELEQL